MLNDQLNKMTAAITAAIRETPEFTDYEKKKKLARSNPETRNLVELARNIQGRFLEIPEDQRNGDYAESLQNEYEEITENTAVYDYLRSEAVFMTMLQEVLGSIIESVDIEI